VCNRIEIVLSWCAARGHRPKGPNLAASSGKFEDVLPKRSKLARRNHHAAVPYGELPALMAQRRTREGVGFKALQFLTLTAARSSQLLSATWDEIDFGNAVWTVPAARAKSHREHRVPLAQRALALLKDLYREEGNPFLFVVARNEARGDAAMSSTLYRLGCNATVHGMRLAFSTWAHEQTAHSNHVIEMALAHAVGTNIEKVYPRTDLFSKRRKLTEQWAAYCCSPSAVTGAVVRLRSA
jgi:integrase